MKKIFHKQSKEKINVINLYGTDRSLNGLVALVYAPYYRSKIGWDSFPFDTPCDNFSRFAEPFWNVNLVGNSVRYETHFVLWVRFDGLQLTVDFWESFWLLTNKRNKLNSNSGDYWFTFEPNIRECS